MEDGKTGLRLLSENECKAIMGFPKKFIFGTAVASYQVEGGIYNNDWTIWENNNNSKCEELCGEACKHYELVNEDIKLLKNLGIRAFRFSIEWSRIQPEKK